MDHNTHILKWYRWQIFLAKQQGRLFAQTMLIEWYNEELKASHDRH